MKKIFSLLLMFLFLISCNNNVGTSFNSEINYDDVIFDAFTLNDYGKLHDVTFLDSIGEKNILVVPILFKDYSMNFKEIEKMEKDIELAFFGKSEDIDFESVSSYYYKSSYGKLNITGEVSETVIVDKSVIEIVNLTKETNIYKGVDSDNYYDNTYYPINYAIEYLRSKMDLTKYDKNKDGILDSVWFIYGEEFYTQYCYENKIFNSDPLYDKIHGFLWAYTYFYKGENNIDNPAICAYSFASYRFMYVNPISNIDSHIYIHETGHLLGLKDYYNYDYKAVKEDGEIDNSMPSGGLDMMDLNIGDHSSYSKLLLNWIEPKVICESNTYTLNEFVTTGESILIPISKINNSPFMTYLLIEYYTPTGINEFDSKNSYRGSYPKMFTKNGFKVYRINSRLASPSSKSVTYIDDFSKIGDYNYIDFVTSNTPSKSMLNRYNYETAYNDRLITLLSKSKDKFYVKNKESRFANNVDLFVDGNEFVYSENNISIKISFMECLKTNGKLKVEVNI